jgi:hypothetical protein
MEALNPRGPTEILQSLGQVARRAKRRPLLALFSDLLDDPMPVIQTLRSLEAKKYEVIVFHIMDPAEEDLPFQGPVELEDLEDGSRLRCDPAAIRHLYRRKVFELRNLYASALQSAGIDYVYLQTSTPYDQGLARFLSWRRRRT